MSKTGDIIATLKRHYKTIITFITHDIWHLNLEDFSRVKKRVVKHLKVAIVTLTHFSKDKIGLQSVALSYFATLAFIPFIAVIFAITSGFGFSNNLEELIHLNFSTNPEIVDKILEFSGNIIETAKSGPYGIISFLIFVWLVIWLMLSVERSFNNIWRVEKSRKMTKRAIAYIMILFFSPLLVAVFLITPLFVTNALNILDVGNFIRPLSSFLNWALFYLIILVLFTAMYKYIPNAKVPFSLAFKAALISSLAFIAVQFLYMETQIFVSRLNGVYGIFAAIPLFMIWMNFAWFIILFGAELSYAFKYVDNYNVEENVFSLKNSK